MKANIDAVTTIVADEGEKSLNSDHSEAYERLDLQIRSLEAMARETFQYQFRRDYKAVVKKLENGDDLSNEDKELLTQLIVADARSYVKYEKEYEGWKDRISGLLAELKDVQARGIRSKEDLLHIQSVCRGLRAVLPDITHYLRERERIQSYEQNDIQALSPELKELLAGIIKAMMTSDKM